MGLAELEQAVEAVRHSDMADFLGPRDAQVVAAAERELGVTFPPTYRHFVSELGAGGVAPNDFPGVIDGRFDEASPLDVVWVTLDQRRTYGFPTHLIVVGDTGMGEFYVLDTSQPDVDGEYPVVVWVAGGSAEEHLRRETVAADFGSFFWDLVQEALGPQ